MVPDMAQRTEIILTCDVHDGEAAASTTTTLVLDGVGVEIDLCDDHALELKTEVAPFLEFGRSLAPRKSSGGEKRSRSGRSKSENTAIREWAAKNGFSLGDRGRISAEVIEAYANRKK